MLLLLLFPCVLVVHDKTDDYDVKEEHDDDDDDDADDDDDDDDDDCSGTEVVKL